MNDTELEIECIDIIASMAYQTKLNVECLEGKIRKLRPSSLKDIVILYNENQKNWLDKLNRGLKKIGLIEKMQEDLSSQDLAYYSICCEFLRMSKDLSSISDILETAKDVEDINPVLANIKAILFNQQSKFVNNEKA